jgi:peptidoglycan/LPS O-acetylase OafA/YrhL
MSAERLLFVDGLRGIAAASVMLYHDESRVGVPVTGGLGFLGVAIFFALSGFVIAMSIADRPLSFKFLGRFALRRSLRLDLPYWACLLLLIFVAMFGAAYGANQPMPTPGQLVAHLFYAQDLLGYPPLSPVFWSLCYEIQFYLFLVVLMMVLSRLDQTVALVVFCITIALSLLERSIVDVTPTGVAFVFWFNFAIGALTYWVISGRTKAGFLYAMLGLVLLEAIVFDDSFAYASVATCAALYGAAKLGRMGTWLSGRAFQFLGRTSYSIYILHNIVGWYALSLALKFTPPLVALAIGIAAAIVSAWVAYEVVERPSIRLSRIVRL